jgi:hypothetical protein
VVLCGRGLGLDWAGMCLCDAWPRDAEQ